MVRVTVEVQNGLCQGTAPNCAAFACEVTVTREWNLPNGTEMGWCTVRPPPQLPICAYPPPVVEPPGSGSDVDSDSIRCGISKTYTLETSSLNAQASGSCSQCN